MRQTPVKEVRMHWHDAQQARPGRSSLWGDPDPVNAIGQLDVCFAKLRDLADPCGSPGHDRPHPPLRPRLLRVRPLVIQQHRKSRPERKIGCVRVELPVLDHGHPIPANPRALALRGSLTWRPRVSDLGSPSASTVRPRTIATMSTGTRSIQYNVGPISGRGALTLILTSGHHPFRPASTRKSRPRRDDAQNKGSGRGVVAWGRLELPTYRL